MYKNSFLFLICFIASLDLCKAQIDYPGKKPGAAAITKTGETITLQDNALSISFITTNKSLNVSAYSDKQSGEHLNITREPLFSLAIGGKEITSDEFTLLGAPQLSDLSGDNSQPGYAAKLSGKKLSADLQDARLKLTIHWEANLLDGSNYVRQIFTFNAADSVKISRITLIRLPSAIGLKNEGKVDGSPLVHNNMFFALEHPMSQTSANKINAAIYLPRLNAIYNSVPLTISSVWGVSPAGQMRRAFLYYIERERAVPYRQMLHYNSWFDISWDNRKLNDSLCLDRIKGFKDSLIDKRNVKLSAFLFDDGWDDNKTLWQFNPGFKNGFTDLAKAAKGAHSTLGVWISPWGGYNEPKEQRLSYGKKQDPPFETNENGFSLTGPNYYKRFKAVTTSFIKNYDISIFKFDGVGAGNGASGASITYQKDIEAFLKLIGDLRSEKPELYLSLTVGTWPSVYWLKYGDAIWRAGDDTGLGGEGPKRQQWITYKDGQAFENIVKRAPLYPLNAVMYHGVCIADNGLPGTLEMDNKNISDEIWTFFGSGTSLQELYVNPHKLNEKNWDCLRDAIKWSKAHTRQLADIHWVGGDPLKGDVYGFAGWADKKGVLTLRNPTSHVKTFVVHTGKVFEIPAGNGASYSFFDARSRQKAPLYSGNTLSVKLAPFEVKVMDAKAL